MLLWRVPVADRELLIQIMRELMCHDYRDLHGWEPSPTCSVFGSAGMVGCLDGGDHGFRTRGNVSPCRRQASSPRTTSRFMTWIPLRICSESAVVEAACPSRSARIPVCHAGSRATGTRTPPAAFGRSTQRPGRPSQTGKPASRTEPRACQVGEASTGQAVRFRFMQEGGIAMGSGDRVPERGGRDLHYEAYTHGLTTGPCRGWGRPRSAGYCTAAGPNRGRRPELSDRVSWGSEWAGTGAEIHGEGVCWC